MNKTNEELVERFEKEFPDKVHGGLGQLYTQGMIVKWLRTNLPTTDLRVIDIGEVLEILNNHCPHRKEKVIHEIEYISVAKAITAKYGQPSLKEVFSLDECPFMTHTKHTQNTQNRIKHTQSAHTTHTTHTHITNTYTSHT